jgi:anthranilate 1,2-dioxygenase small subunit
MSAQIGEAAAQLLDEYVERIDSDRLEEWLELFTEDASYQVLPRENLEQNLPASIIFCSNRKMLRDRIVSLRNANLYNPHYDRHLVSGVRVKPQAEGVWQLTANYAVYQSTHEGQSKLFSVGGYRDELRMHGGRLLFSKKLVIVDTFAVPSLLATPL